MNPRKIDTFLKLVIVFLIGILIGSTLATVTLAEPVKYCYEPYGPYVEPEFIATRTVIEVVWLLGPRGDTAESSWHYDEETGVSVCKIWVRLPDQVLGDPDMNALGHEVLHCLAGNFYD